MSICWRKGTHRRLYEKLGAHPITLEGTDGVAFAVWAPNARRVSVVGDFNGWDGRRHPMRKRHEAGVWELFVPGVPSGALSTSSRSSAPMAGCYRSRPTRSDFSQEAPPSTASRVHGLVEHDWADGAWMDSRSAAQDRSAPISIYEVHLGSWRRGDGNSFFDYDRLADELIPYVRDLGFTHIELLPISEHPFSGSWGYQPIGLFAPTARFGPIRRLSRVSSTAAMRTASACLLDWVPAHFPSDPHGLVRFDGTALYEHEDPAPRVPQGLEHADLQFRPAGGRELSAIERVFSGSTATISTACGSMRSPPCSISTTAASPASGSPMFMAGGRTSKR